MDHGHSSHIPRRVPMLGGMGEDLDDTVITPPQHPASTWAGAADVDDTVVGPAAARPHYPPPDAMPESPVVAGHSAYGLRIGLDGEPIPLDLPCFVGRRPSPPRVTRGGQPRLVRVASPHKEVSATHLEVRQLGASVVVTDLKSTNGTIVMVPGRKPRTLRQGESVVVSPGTLVDIGDDNILQILPIQRLGHSPAGRQP